jgi:hypothetical protein
MYVMKTVINKGDRVSWGLGDSMATGQVIDLYINNKLDKSDGDDMSTDRKVEKTARALLIEMEDGRKILKMEHEVMREW